MRRRYLTLPVLLTLTVVLVTAGLLFREQERDVDLAKKADEVAYEYGVEVTRFETRVHKAVRKVVKEHPATIADVIRREIKNPPELPEVSESARALSPAYQHAEREAPKLLDRFLRAAADLDHAEKGIVFLEAATAALLNDAPASTFTAVPVPDGAAKAAEAVREALASDGLAFIEAYDIAEEELRKYSLSVDAEIQDSLEQVEIEKSG